MTNLESKLLEMNVTAKTMVNPLATSKEELAAMLSESDTSSNLKLYAEFVDAVRNEIGIGEKHPIVTLLGKFVAGHNVVLFDPGLSKFDKLKRMFNPEEGLSTVKVDEKTFKVDYTNKFLDMDPIFETYTLKANFIRGPQGGVITSITLKTDDLVMTYNPSTGKFDKKRTYTKEVTLGEALPTSRS